MENVRRGVERTRKLDVDGNTATSKAGNTRNSPARRGGHDSRGIRLLADLACDALRWRGRGCMSRAKGCKLATTGGLGGGAWATDGLMLWRSKAKSVAWRQWCGGKLWQSTLTATSRQLGWSSGRVDSGPKLPLGGGRLGWIVLLACRE